MSINYEKYRDNLIRLGRWPSVGRSPLDLPAPFGSTDRSVSEAPRVQSIREIRYRAGLERPNYPVPAIPLAVKYNYKGCVNIDDVTDPDDPVIVYFYDSWAKP